MKNCIINGDCTEVLKTIADESVDFVLTDPPYFVRYKDRTGRTIANDSRPESVLGAFDDLYRVLKPDTFCISFYGWNRVDAFFPRLEKRRLHARRTYRLAQELRVQHPLSERLSRTGLRSRQGPPRKAPQPARRCPALGIHRQPSASHRKSGQHSRTSHRDLLTPPRFGAGSIFRQRQHPRCSRSLGPLLSWHRARFPLLPARREASRRHGPVHTAASRGLSECATSGSPLSFPRDNAGSCI